MAPTCSAERCQTRSSSSPSPSSTRGMPSRTSPVLTGSVPSCRRLPGRCCSPSTSARFIMRCLPSLNRDLPSIRKAPFRSTRSLVLAFLAACGSREPERLGTAAGPVVLPTGRRLEPAGRIIDVGNMPLSVQLAPDGRHAVLLLSGWRECGLQVVDLAAGQITQTLSQPGAFVGLAFSPDGRWLYTSGAGQDLVYRYAWSDGRATLADSIVLGQRDTASAKKRFPAGLALSADGK